MGRQKEILKQKRGNDNDVTEKEIKKHLIIENQFFKKRRRKQKTENIKNENGKEREENGPTNKEIDRDRQRDRQRDRETQRQTQRQINRQKDRQKERKKERVHKS